MTGNKLYEANHLCMMKQHLLKKKKNYKKTTTSRYHSSIVKTTSHIKNAEKVSNFAARWCSIRKHLIQSKAGNQGKQCKIQQQNEKYTTRLQSNKREFIPIESKPLLFSFLLEIKTNTRRLRNSRGKKNRKCLRQLYEAIIPT